MTAFRKSIFVVAVAVGLGACTSPPDPQRMVVTPAIGEPIPDGLRNAIFLGRTGGGEYRRSVLDIPVDGASFRQALEASLASHSLATADPERSAYVLNAEVRSVDADSVFNLSPTAVAEVEYTLRSRDGAEVWRETVSVPYTASFSTSIFPNERLKAAKEGAIRANVKAFIDRLRLVFLRQPSRREEASRPPASLMPMEGAE